MIEYSLLNYGGQVHALAYATLKVSNNVDLGMGIKGKVSGLWFVVITSR